MNITDLDLSKQELLDFMQILHDALLVKCDEDLPPLLLQLSKLIPCEHIIVGIGKTDREGHLQNVVKLINVSYPSEWIAHYQQNDYAKIDPILRLHSQKFETQVWSETFANIKGSKELAFVEDAQAYGIGQGITMGQLNVRKSLGSLLSFSGRNMGEHLRHKSLLEYILPHLHLALMRTAFPASNDFKALSSREKEVMRWLMEGKTNWETSRILNISERTVKFHVQNILSKLRSSTRGHAIALAIESGLVGVPITSIEIEDALKHLSNETVLDPK